ncbi:MAG: chromate transporter [Clostridia bacterium]|nr:chromate transporter [Clostridia bacterium]
MIYLELLLGFLRVGCFSFGGAYGAIPLIREVVLSYGWLPEEMLAYMIAVSESSPGPIMVNMATYIGSSQAGLPGAILATLAVVLPAFLIILLIVSLSRRLLKTPYVQAVLGGLKPCVIGIVLATGIDLVLRGVIGSPAAPVVSLKAALLTLILAAILYGYRWLTKKKLSPILLIAAAALLGIAAGA